MPTYSYHCPKCDQNFEAFHSMKCVEPQFCPTCGEAGKKLMTASSIIFKGSGFYTTDYRDSGYVEAQKRDGTSSSAKAEPSAPSTGPAGGSTGGTTTPSATPAATPASSPTTSPTGSSGGSSSGGGAPPAAKSAASTSGDVARAA